MTGSDAADGPVTFYFPYREVSGVPVLFSRMARALAARGVPVEVVDYAEGYMARTLGAEPGIEVRPFRPGEPIRIGADALLVMQSILPATIAPELHVHERARLLFWTLHPMNLVQAIVPLDAVRQMQARSAAFHRAFARTVLRRLTGQLGSLVLAMHRRHAIAFMDGETLDATSERLGVRIDEPLWLPVPVPVPARNLRGPKPASDPFSMAWLGRLGDFKIHVLLRTLAEASRVARDTKRRIAFHVIGDGPDQERIRTGGFDHDWFTVIRHGVVTGPALDELLLRQVDLLAAMGTSALEGGKLGVPTILLDVAYGPVPASYKFRWLFDSDRCTLGRFVDRRCLEPGNRSMAERIAETMEDPAGLSERTYRHCVDRHALDTVTDRFLEAAARVEFRWGDMDPALLRKGLVRAAYEGVRRWRTARTVVGV